MNQLDLTVNGVGAVSAPLHIVIFLALVSFIPAILVIIGQLWLVFVTYKEVVAPAFFASFVITVLLFRMAFFDRDQNPSTSKSHGGR